MLSRPAVIAVVSTFSGSGMVVLHVVEEGAEGDADLIVLDQERVVPVRAVQLHGPGRYTVATGGGHDLLALVERVEDVALHADGEDRHADARHRRIRATAAATDVVEVHRL